MFPVENLRGYLTGDWRVERSVIDRRSGKRHEFAGSASFSLDPDTDSDSLLYQEQINTVLETYEGLSTQSYVYRFSSVDEAQVQFRDGRDFHPLDLSSGICRVQHWCEPDTYEGVFRSITEHEWRVRWKVTGPRKHYFLETRLLRKRRRDSSANATS